MTPTVSILIPAYNEEKNIASALQAILDSVRTEHEVLVVVDSNEDTTHLGVSKPLLKRVNGRILIQNYGSGPANAIRFGFDAATAKCVVVTMADGSDDVRLIDDLSHLVSRGCAVAAASRYMAGGAQIGGSRLKKFLSKSAGLSLYYLAGVGTKDATNSFKAYDADFVRSVGIDSRSGFEIGIELVAKAHRANRPIAELPTIWLDRNIGDSRFQMTKWLPKYLRWYRYAFGPKILSNQVVTQTAKGENK